MLVIVGIILLLAWLFDYAVHLTAGSLVDLLLILATISFALDFLRTREENRPRWDHRPPSARPGGGTDTPAPTGGGPQPSAQA